MFSGLTNQVSTWMAKKTDNGTEMPAEANPEGNPELEKDSPTKGGGSGGKLEMLAGVKSQMTGWLSGGIPGLSGRGATAPVEGEAQSTAQSDDVDATGAVTSIGQNVQGGTATDQVKDDDASRWASDATGGADSGPASLEGTPTDDKEGQQAFGAGESLIDPRRLSIDMAALADVSTKALAGAKSLGGFLYSAVNKAGKTVVEASVKIKKTVEENRLIAELNKEQESFIAEKHSSKGEAVAPWVGAPNEDALREECLSLSTDRRNFVRSPPPGVEFTWDFEAIQPVAQATLALDPNLQSMRFELVPKIVSEENFWRNYFYRVSLLRQSHELNAMASQEQSENNPNQSLITTDSIDNTQVQVSNDQETSATVTSGDNSTLADSPGHEFVSDSMRVSDTDLEEVREGMKKLGMQPPKEEDWERELEAELNEYEFITSGSQDQKGAAFVSDVTSDTDDWEKRIDEILQSNEEEKKAFHVTG